MQGFTFGLYYIVNYTVPVQRNNKGQLSGEVQVDWGSEGGREELGMGVGEIRLIWGIASSDKSAFKSGLSSADTTAFFLRDFGRSGSSLLSITWSFSAISIGVGGGTLCVTVATGFSPECFRSVRGGWGCTRVVSSPRCSVEGRGRGCIALELALFGTLCRLGAAVCPALLPVTPAMGGRTTWDGLRD